MKVSTHAKIRMQQRAIPFCIVDLLLQYGAREHACDHASIVYFDKKGRDRLVGEITGETYKKIEKKLHSYLIIQGELIVTTGYRHRRIKRNL